MLTAYHVCRVTIPCDDSNKFDKIAFGQVDVDAVDDAAVQANIRVSGVVFLSLDCLNMILMLKPVASAVGACLPLL